jgi:hypothetical protein
MEQNFDAAPDARFPPATEVEAPLLPLPPRKKYQNVESVESLVKTSIAIILALDARFLSAPKRHKFAFCVKKTISTCLNQIHFVNSLSVTSVSGFKELDKRQIVGDDFAVLRQVHRQHLDPGSKNARSPH